MHSGPGGKKVILFGRWRWGKKDTYSRDGKHGGGEDVTKVCWSLYLLPPPCLRLPAKKMEHNNNIKGNKAMCTDLFYSKIFGSIVAFRISESEWVVDGRKMETSFFAIVADCNRQLVGWAGFIKQRILQTKTSFLPRIL